MTATSGRRCGARLTLLAALWFAHAVLSPAVAATGHRPKLMETPALADAVARGTLPPVEQRVPARPLVVRFDGKQFRAGVHGGELRTLIRDSKDVKLIVVYGYARLVGYTPRYDLVPDILEDVVVEGGRSFTLTLRAGHKWSDGHPFTAEDFRYWWEDVANNPELSPNGPPKDILVDGEAPRFEVLNERTVRYSWSRRNPFFLPRLAGASPLFIYRPAHYLRQFHRKYAEPSRLAAAVRDAKVGGWAALHDRLDSMYLADNPDLPTLDPWVIRTRPPSTRFVAERNPFFHRIDERGRQLPYIDRLVLTMTASDLIPAKAGTGEADLVARGLAFHDYAFLREATARNGLDTLLWTTANGAHIALFPNLNANDPVWRALMRDVRFRRALSLSIDREAINEFLYFGLARPGNNTVLAESPLYEPQYQKKWASYDPEAANELLDEIGLARPDPQGLRRLPDGRALRIVVETAGEQPEQVDALELIAATWREVGVGLVIKPSHRDILRSRATAGEPLMVVWSGLENGLPTADMSPQELVPNSRINFQWPKWGYYAETDGKFGEPVDLPAVRELQRLNEAWLNAADRATRAAIWHDMLAIHADQVFTIGIVAGVRQPVVVSKRLRNVPREAVYNWDPGAFFGIYRPDTFWFED